MFHDFCQSVTLVFCQRTHVSHDHHPRGPCCSRARISYDEPCMGAIFYQKIFASALIHCYMRITVDPADVGDLVTEAPAREQLLEGLLGDCICAIDALLMSPDLNLDS